MGEELIRYDAMCHAIAECHAVDEVKQIVDKARALEVYAAQAKNKIAEKQAKEIRLRAERRAGELLREMKDTGERDAGAGGDRKSRCPEGTVIPPTLADLGISKKQSAQWQALAEVPDEKFETALSDPDHAPSRASIIGEITAQAPEMNPQALWLWGILRDFRDRKMSAENPRKLFNAMETTMQDDVAEIAPQLMHWLLRLRVDRDRKRR